MSRSPKLVRCYIDGFNLYHAIEALQRPELKWLNYHRLAESLLRDGEKLEAVTFFTAVLNWDAAKRKRHVNFLHALRAVGVCVVEGAFKKGKRYCYAWDHFCTNREEKQTDVAIALGIVSDAYEDRFDRAILMSADSDHIPVANLLKDRFPDKRLSLVAPPGRMREARDLGNRVHDRMELKPGRLATCRLPHNVYDAAGKKVASMPAIYKNE